MGMFDEIRCEAKLPDDKFQTPHTFQSKDLDCLLDVYTITTDGRLMCKPFCYRGEEPQPERPVDHHGYLHFYDFDDEAKVMINYRAKFTDDRLIEITRVSDD